MVGERGEGGWINEVLPVTDGETSEEGCFNFSLSLSLPLSLSLSLAFAHSLYALYAIHHQADTETSTHVTY